MFEKNFRFIPKTNVKKAKKCLFELTNESAGIKIRNIMNIFRFFEPT